MRGSVSAPDPQLSPHCHWPEDRARAVRCGSARWGPTGQEPSVGAAAHIFLANRIRLWIKILADKRRAGTNGMPVRHTHTQAYTTDTYLLSQSPVSKSDCAPASTFFHGYREMTSIAAQARH